MAALTAVPAAVTAARGGNDLAMALAASALVGGAGLAYAIDDDAHAVLASSPTPLWARRVVRLAVVFGVIAVGWAVTAGFAAAADAGRSASLSRPLGVGLAASGVGLATAGCVYRRVGMERPGMTGVVAGVLIVLVISALATRFPMLPSVASATHHDRWLWLAGGTWAIAAWTSRDLARRAL